jgi:undecaprenyl pyrophosphate phosphatase UppP
MTNEPDADRRLAHVASIATLVAVTAGFVAAAAIRLLLTEPMTIASTIDTGGIFPLLRQLAEVVYKTMAGVLHYL